MLKKLYKYDWKSVSMLLLVLHGVLLAYSIIGRLIIAIIDNFSSHGVQGTGIHSPLSTALLGMGAAAYIIIYVVFIIGIVLVTLLYLAIRLQKSLFSDEGYLTNTLPVSPDKLLWSKIFIFWTWGLIDFLCVALSVFILISYPDTLPEIFRGFKLFFSSLFGFEGLQSALDTITLVLGMIIEYFFYYTFLVLFSVCLGSLFKTHKTLGAVVSFFGINILQCIILVFLLLAGTLTASTVTGEMVIETGHWGVYFMLLWFLLLSAGFYFGSRYILTRKLNLD